MKNVFVGFLALLLALVLTVTTSEVDVSGPPKSTSRTSGPPKASDATSGPSRSTVIASGSLSHLM